MNRREFLRRSSIVAASGLFARSRLLAAATAPTPAGRPPGQVGANFGEFRPLRRDVGVFVGRGGTIAWLASNGALAVVDTQFPDTAAMCLAGIPGRAGRTVDVVLNTHHHADHTSGNPTFRPVARTIVAQANVPRLQFEAARRAEASGKPGLPLRLDQQVYADTTFAEVWRHELGDEVVTAQYFGPAHTGGDAVVMFERANVVHVGDLVFNRLYPVIDRVAGGSVKGWIKVLEEVARAYPQDATYVFGHGSSKFGIVGSHADLVVMRDYWSAVLARVEKEIAAGRSRAEIAGLGNLDGFPDFHTSPPNRLADNLAAAYDELTATRG
ncbi:MAG TPA: MBL fold metallo-hydrolase [Opitutaceae bacterium]|nr:MBL fold metallo-hydrolase [Opitutaceae bacterium]